jgi:2,3-bisphosphoglycerate-dependent phosphoglycerate mutase
VSEHATRLLLVRHGQTAWNASARVQGHVDIPLNALGRWQAERTAERLAECLQGETLAAIYASDLQRAWATAEPLARALAPTGGVPLRAEPGLRERRFGQIEGLSFADVEAQHPEWALRWRQREPGFGPPGGERLLDFHERALATATRLAQAHAGQHIALFTHGGVLDCLYRAATGQALDAPRSWVLGNASINRLLHHGQGFVLVGWNDDAHLQAPPEHLD